MQIVKFDVIIQITVKAVYIIFAKAFLYIPEGVIRSKGDVVALDGIQPLADVKTVEIYFPFQTQQVLHWSS